MMLSVEVSLYPLADNYLPVIDRFIRSLYKYPGLKVSTSVLSTRIIGHYDEVMQALHHEIYATFTETEQASFVLKILKGDAEQEVNLDGYR
jgi:uncharacterized protein YqgV (UPF0045/DUF77 family)